MADALLENDVERTKLELQDNKLKLVSLESAKLSVGIWNDPDAILIHNNDTGATCAVKRVEEIVYVVFRYTATEQDWHQNMKFWPKICRHPVYQDVKIHTGFWEQYSSISNTWKNTVKNLFDPSRVDPKNTTEKARRVVFTGFSLGAALAEIAAWDYRVEFLGIIDCIVFGCPRVGNSMFAQEFNKHITTSARYYYGMDPCPALPPLLLGYRHVKNPIHLRHDGTIENSDRSTLTNAKLLISWVLHLPGARNHGKDHTVKPIIKYLSDINLR